MRILLRSSLRETIRLDQSGVVQGYCASIHSTNERIKYEKHNYDLSKGKIQNVNKIDHYESQD